jgi:hypothetical protein
MCEVEMMKSLRSSGVKTVNGIVLDVGASESMSRVLLRLISGFSARSIGMLSEGNYVVVAEMKNNNPWRAIFMDRFRSEISPFAPSAEARLVFGDQREYAVFSSGASDYYATLANFETRLNAESNEMVTVKTVTSGHAAYVPDFDPPFLTNSDFENPRAFEQYHRQRPIGMQVLFQFELEKPKMSLVLNEEVLWRYDLVSELGDWIAARVFGQNNDLTYDISTESHGFGRSVRRGFLRKLVFDEVDDDDVPPPIFDVGANVLVPNIKLDCWQQGTVLSQSEDGNSYTVRLYTGKELVVEDIELLLPLMERSEDVELPELSMVTLSSAFKESLESVMPEEDFSSLTLSEHAIRKGATMIALWKGGNAVLVWSGERRIDINLFLNQPDEEAANEFYDSFMDEVPFLETLARDRQPRGFGGVVNFGDHLVDETPIWWQGGDKADS